MMPRLPRLRLQFFAGEAEANRSTGFEERDLRAADINDAAREAASQGGHWAGTLAGSRTWMDGKSGWFPFCMKQAAPSLVASAAPPAEGRASLPRRRSRKSHLPMSLGKARCSACLPCRIAARSKRCVTRSPAATPLASGGARSDQRLRGGPRSPAKSRYPPAPP
jgi:hypothetical protein